MERTEDGIRITVTSPRSPSSGLRMSEDRETRRQSHIVTQSQSLQVSESPVHFSIRFLPSSVFSSDIIMTFPSKLDPSKILQIRQKETGNAEKTTLYNQIRPHSTLGDTPPNPAAFIPFTSQLQLAAVT